MKTNGQICFLGDPHEVEAFNVFSYVIHFINAL